MRGGVLDKTALRLRRPKRSSIISSPRLFITICHPTFGARPESFPAMWSNGLEDSTMKQWQYWDGKIIQGARRQIPYVRQPLVPKQGHERLGGSVAVHAVSDNPTDHTSTKVPVTLIMKAGKGTM